MLMTEEPSKESNLMCGKLLDSQNIERALRDGRFNVAHWQRKRCVNDSRHVHKLLFRRRRRRTTGPAVTRDQLPIQLSSNMIFCCNRIPLRVPRQKQCPWSMLELKLYSSRSRIRREAHT